MIWTVCGLLLLLSFRDDLSVVSHCLVQSACHLHLGKRLGYDHIHELRHPWHRIPLVWIIWYVSFVLFFFLVPLTYLRADFSLHAPGFDGGSALSANFRAAQACIVTDLAASVDGLWVGVLT